MNFHSIEVIPSSPNIPAVHGSTIGFQVRHSPPHSPQCALRHGKDAIQLMFLRLVQCFYLMPLQDA